MPSTTPATDLHGPTVHFVFSRFGIDATKLTAAELDRGVELIRRISQCESVPGSCQRPAAVAAWKAFLKKHALQSGKKRVFDRNHAAVAGVS
jgi:hypothetical protein